MAGAASRSRLSLPWREPESQRRVPAAILRASAIAGLAAVGSLRAAELLLGPFNVITKGIGMMGVPEATRMLRRSVRRLQLFCLLLGSLQAAGTLVWGLALLVLLPKGLGAWLLAPHGSRHPSCSCR